MFPGNKTTTRSVSSHFNSNDADINFLSSDGVVFKIHSKNLEYTSGGFPPSEFLGESGGEDNVPLLEDSETLQILFGYVYPRRHPNLEKTEFGLVAKIAEAAEKYQVYSAMTVCQIRMKEQVSKHPLEVFNYSFKHGYQDVKTLTAPYLHDIPLALMVDKLPPGLAIPWVKYHEKRRSTILQAFLANSSSYECRLPSKSAFDSLSNQPSTCQHCQHSSTSQPSTGNRPVTFSFGPPKPTPVSQPEQATMDPRTLCVAMHDFYQLNPSNTAMSAVQLEIAIRQAFPTIRVDAGSDVNESCPRVRKELVDVFVQKLQQKLAQLPPFEAFA